jgi:hypothetical protein
VAEGRIRFRLQTDGGVGGDGWHLDDLMLRAVSAGQEGLFFGDSFETGALSAWSF